MRYGISLVKRASTPWCEAHHELSRAIRDFYGLADYVTLNPGKNRPAPEVFAAINHQLPRARVPLVIKLPACWQVREVLANFAQTGVDGFLLSAEGMDIREHLACLHHLRTQFGQELSLISVGGMTTLRDVRQRLRAGASLVQMHSILRKSPRRAQILASLLRRSALCCKKNAPANRGVISLSE